MAETERLECRIPKAVKALTERAAELEGLTLSSFVTIALKRAADESVAQHQASIVSARDWRQMMDSLREANYAPTPEAQEGSREYRHFLETGRLSR